MNRSRFAQLCLVSTLGFLAACNSSGGGSTPIIPDTLTKLIFSRDIGEQNNLFLIKEDGMKTEITKNLLIAAPLYASLLAISPVASAASEN